MPKASYRAVTAVLVLGLVVSLYFAVVGVLSFAAYGESAALFSLALILVLVLRRFRRSTTIADNADSN